MAQDQRGAERAVIYDGTIVPPPNGDGSDIGAIELAPGVTPLSAVSRKVHGAAGEFDIDLPMTGPLGIECRSGGGSMDFQIVLTFANSVTAGTAMVTSGTGTVTSVSVDRLQAEGAPGGETEVTISLTGVTNAQRLTVGLLEVNDGSKSGDVGVSVGVDLGDTTGDGAVNASDISQTKAQAGQAVTASNFRNDVTVTGTINASDIGLVKAHSGINLP